MFCICGGGGPDNHSAECLIQEARHHNPNLTEADERQIELDLATSAIEKAADRRAEEGIKNHRPRVYKFGVLWFWKCSRNSCLTGGRARSQPEAFQQALDHVHEAQKEILRKRDDWVDRQIRQARRQISRAAV